MPETLPATAAPHDRLSFHHGLRTALAAALAYWLTELFHLPAGYWAAISAIVVMQSEVGATMTASRDRFIGTTIGAFIGWVTALIWHNSIVIFALAVLLAIVICTGLRFQNAGRLAGVAVAIIVLVPHVGPAWHVAIERFLEVSFGIGVSLVVALAWKKIADKIDRQEKKSAS